MKNALLLSLALIAVGPVAVEGQNSDSEDLVNRLMQTRTCVLRDLGGSRPEEMCTYRLPGVEFDVRDSGSVLVLEQDRNFAGSLNFNAARNFLMVVTQDPLAIAVICVGPRLTGKFVESGGACR